MQLSEKEQQASKIFDAILERYFQHTKPDEFKHSFLSQIDKIEKTELYQVLKKFPKGAALHLHWVSSGRNEALLNYVLEHASMFYQFEQEHDDQYHKGEIRYWKENPGQGWIRIDRLLQRVGKDSFVKDSLQKMKLDPSDETGSSENRWKKFQSIFDNFYFGLTFFAPLAKYYHLDLVKSFIDDNVQYAEYRSPFTFFYNEEGEKMDQRQAAQFFEECKKAAVEKYGSDKWLGGKWIQESMRMFDREVVRKEMDISYQLQNDMPSTVVGFDLVGEEDTGHSCEYFEKDVLELKEKGKKEGKKFDVIFHLGETNHNTCNIRSGLECDTVRIGHGYNLMRFPEQLDEVKKRDVPLEVCPVSNTVLGLIQDRRNHPMVNFLAHQVPFVMSSDDPQIFSYTGVTHDFFFLATASHISLPKLKQVALNSIKFACLSDEERQQLHKMWEERYNEWLDYLISTQKES